MSILSDATRYATELGWCVVVLHGLKDGGCTCKDGRNCPSSGKHPRQVGWDELPPPTPQMIQLLLQAFPGSNIGVKLGTQVVDVEFDDAEGERTAQRLLVNDLRTPTYKSARSLHRLYRPPQGLPPTKAWEKIDGLEIRLGLERAAQSVLPPSRHASGVAYEWQPGLDPFSVQPLPFPAALADLLRRPGNGQQSNVFVMQGDLQTHPGATQGERNRTLCILAGSYLGARGADADLMPLALAFGERCTPPLTAVEVQKTVTKLAEREMSKRVAIQPTPQPLVVVSRPFAEIPPQDVRWLWQQRIAIGKLSLLCGQPGLGKTFLACDVLARVSRGTAFPDGSPCPVGDGFILTAEDGAGDTLHPRLVAAGADLTRVHHIEGLRSSDGKEVFLSLDQHLPLIDQWLKQRPHAVLLVVDPISAFLGRVDSHNNSEVRGVLGPLARLAELHGVAIVGITHLSKKDAKAINRIIGSIAFVAAARSAWLVAADQDDENGRCLFLPVKNNLGVASGLAFRLTDGRVEWEDLPVLVSADDVEAEGDSSPRQEAVEWLQTLLAAGPVSAGTVWGRAKTEHIAERTLKRAKRDLGIVSERVGEHWVWRLPDNQQTGGERYVF